MSQEKKLFTTLQVLTEAQSLLDSEKVDKVLKKIDRCEDFLKRFGSLEELIDSYERLEKLLYTTKEFLTVDETAAYLGLSKSRVYKLAENKEVPTYKPNGKNLFFAREELNDWIRRGKVHSMAEIEAKAQLAASTYMMNNRRMAGGM